MENKLSANFRKNHKSCKHFMVLILKLELVQPDGYGLKEDVEMKEVGAIMLI